MGYIITKTLMNKSEYPRWSVAFNVIIWALIFMLLGTLIGENLIGRMVRNACFTLGFSVMFISHLFIKKKTNLLKK